MQKHQKLRVKPNKQRIYYNERKYSYGEYLLISLESGYITPQQVESIRKVFVRYTSRTIKTWIKLSTVFNKTAKAKESRMGKGKGKINLTLARVFPGTPILEITQNKHINPIIFKIVKSKIPLKTKFVAKNRLNRN